ncbi:MAG: GNAT family N-acetyltransferase [Sphaerochaetaceae bacterium]|jgi:L-amino acid N-acyltransferase YncA|nr:GNAT family N-acetyltransferase [Sphaerochaetaceae bacterium]
MNNDVIIRDAQISDAEEILAIYRPYVEQTAISFELQAPGLEEMSRRIEKISSTHPYLVLVSDGRICGYTYAGPLKSRPAYRASVETTIYVAGQQREKGYGRALIQALEERLLAQGFTNMYASIAFPRSEDEYLDLSSFKFHAAMGFDLVGHFHGCGTKFGHVYDIVWMEKILGNAADDQD